jgi:hypothetical protein
VAPDERVEQLHPNTWCTGEPGIARAAWLAARAVDHAGHTGRALELARHVAERILAGVPAGFAHRHDLCCGGASVGHVLHRFFEDTGEPRFRDAASAVLTRLHLPVVESFQFGRTGVLAALLTACTDIELDWDVGFGMALPR